MEEKRKVERFALHIESRISRHGRSTNHEGCTLFSADISSAGIFLLTGAPFPIGTGVDVTMYVPNEGFGPAASQKITLTASGLVVWTNNMGMGIMFDKKSKLAADGHA